LGNVTIDTRKLSDKLVSAGFDRSQAEAVSRKDIEIALAPIKTELAVNKWMIGFNLAFTIAVLWKVFS
jgi:hypothetical protein